jgi:hypothetical protein
MKDALVVPVDPIVDTTISNNQPKGTSTKYFQYASVGRSNMLIADEHKDIDHLLSEFTSNIPTENNRTEKWSEFIRGDNNINHCDPDIDTLPKEAAALSQLQPATVSKIHQILFKILKDNNVTYSLGNFKNKGSFYAVWNKVFDNTCMYCSDYGNKPHQAVVDLDDFQKMSTCFSPLRPEENYGDMLLVIPYKVTQVFCLCAGSEVQYLFLHCLNFHF